MMLPLTSGAARVEGQRGAHRGDDPRGADTRVGDQAEGASTAILYYAYHCLRVLGIE